jgi:hypothetical protein
MSCGTYGEWGFLTLCRVKGPVWGVSWGAYGVYHGVHMGYTICSTSCHLVINPIWGKGSPIWGPSRHLRPWRAQRMGPQGGVKMWETHYRQYHYLEGSPSRNSLFWEVGPSLLGPNQYNCNKNRQWCLSRHRHHSNNLV